MKKSVNIITTISLIIVWCAIIVGFVQEDNVLDNQFLAFLIFFAVASTLEKVIILFEKKKSKYRK